jgi:predicted dehydrogenase
MDEAIGIIGSGTIVDAYYIPTLKRLGFSNILLYDVNEKQASALAVNHGVQAASSQFITNNSGIIIIASPPHTHFEILENCIGKGAHTIVCEKPFLYSRSEAEKIREMAAQSSCNVLVAHIRRCFSAISNARRLIPTLSLGSLKKAHIMEGGRFAYKPKSDYATHNQYGGVLLDTGSHAMDCFLYVTGLTRADLHCKVNSVRKDKAEPSHEVAYLFCLNETEVNLRLSRYEALANKIVLQYENGTVEIPLGLMPNIAVTINGHQRIISYDHDCISYMSQAFYCELGTMLINKQHDTFDAADFITLSYILETLLQA